MENPERPETVCKLETVGVQLREGSLVLHHVLHIVLINGITATSFSISTSDFNSLFTEMFQTLFRTSDVRCEVQKFIIKFTNQFVKLVFDRSSQSETLFTNLLVSNCQISL